LRAGGREGNSNKVSVCCSGRTKQKRDLKAGKGSHFWGLTTGNSGRERGNVIVPLQKPGTREIGDEPWTQFTEWAGQTVKN